MLQEYSQKREEAERVQLGQVEAWCVSDGLLVERPCSKRGVTATRSPIKIVKVYVARFRDLATLIRRILTLYHFCSHALPKFNPKKGRQFLFAVVPSGRSGAS